MFVLDTNVLLYAANRAYEDEHRLCRELVEASRRGSLPWYLTWSIVYEFLRVATHPRVWPTPWSLPEAWAFLESLMESESLAFLSPTDRHGEIATRTLTEATDLKGNVLHDAQTAILMREHGIREIYTRDRDFLRFDFLQVRDPLGERAPRGLQLPPTGAPWPGSPCSAWAACSPSAG